MRFYIFTFLITCLFSTSTRTHAMENFAQAVRKCRLVEWGSLKSRDRSSCILALKRLKPAQQKNIFICICPDYPAISRHSSRRFGCASLKRAIQQAQQ